MKIAVLGAGAWGTALAVNAASRHQVTLWARDASHSKALADQRVNARYLPDMALPDNLRLAVKLRGHSASAFDSVSSH